MEGEKNLEKISRHGLSIVIENPAGSYKDFEIDSDPAWATYPLAGMAYPVPYGYIEGYIGEDGHDLDVFVGTGENHGYIVMERRDVPLETKYFLDCTDSEVNSITEAFKPVLHEVKKFTAVAEFLESIQKFK